jgi:zinc transport system substrate-binding protein
VKKALILILIFIIAIVLFLFVSRSGHTQKAVKNRTVVTTIYPLYFMTQRIAGDTVAVKRLIKPGNEIHSFSPTPADMVTLDRAALFVTLGKDLEPWTEKLAHATDVEILSLEKELTLIHSGAHHHHHAEESAPHRSGINPHVWLDFDNDIKMVRMIRDRLGTLYPEQRAIFVKNASLLMEEFGKIKKSYADGLKTCTKKTLLVGHDAFGYLERSYGFESKSIMGIFAHSKPNAAKLAALSDLVKMKKLHYLFIDPMESSKSAVQLARDMDLTLEPLYTLGNISLDLEKKGEDMLSLLRFDLKQLKKGLECH